jgi:leader peptidase (prepilin peptidase)/N-methyltransferase
LVVDFLQPPLIGTGLAFALGAVVGGCGRRYALRLPLLDEHQPWYTHYFCVELLTGVTFAVFFWLEVVRNVRGVPTPAKPATVSFPLAIIWLYHAVLLGLLLTTALSDVISGEIPVQLAILGALLGILGGTLAPWPWPAPVAPILPEAALGPTRFLASREVLTLPAGLQPWPVAVLSLDWLSPGSWQLGLLTSLTGGLAGSGLIRLFRLLFGWASGKDVMGIGIADQMMLVGAFLGWQAVVLVFPLAFIAAIAYSVVTMLLGRTSTVFSFAPFVAGAAAGTMLFSHGMAAAVLPALFLVLGGSLVLSVALALATRLQETEERGKDERGHRSDWPRER